MACVWRYCKNDLKNPYVIKDIVAGPEKKEKKKKEEVAGSFHSTFDKPVPSEYDWWSGFQSYSIAGINKEWEGKNVNRSGFLTSISKMCITSTLQTASDVFCGEKKKKKNAQESLGNIL